MKNFEQQIQISKIIKRLELIKSLVYLEEETEITLHIGKLKELSPTDEIINIITLLDQKAYSKAMTLIEAYINKYNQITLFNDPEISGLKLEVKSLEAQISILSEEKADLEKIIYDFGVRHNHELGELILKTLRFRKEKAKGTPNESEAERDYHDYSQEYDISKDEKIIDLTDDELKELKQKYRKASKLCHPDVVSEEQKELADKLFAELNLSYERNDLDKVREILQNLERGSFFVNKSDAINKKQLLITEIEKLQLIIKELRQELNRIKTSETFKTISKIDDWDSYFKETKEKLMTQLNILEAESTDHF